ncbi:MAG: diaminopimelate epimerase [Oscillospiraceae bacterium]|nr:diaminopimelate epimerase [Oscillospiraceae bacterium]
MRFTKMQGAGNDYIYVNCFEETVNDPENVSVKVSDRHFGIGADGLVLIMPSDRADVRMRIFNADGSEAKMCGNASRCIGKYVYERGIIRKDTITLETNSGIKILHIDTNDGRAEVSVDMGTAAFKPDMIPVLSTEPMINAPLTSDGVTYTVTAVSMGNPHCVIFGDDPDGIPIERIGKAIEHDPVFPDRVNVEFAQVIDSETIKMRVWERGSGETLACGTGACATAAAAVKNGLCPKGHGIKLLLRGGVLNITVNEEWSVVMSGDAGFICDGEIEI